MTPSILIVNRQRKARVHKDALTKLTLFFLQRAAKLLPKDSPPWESVTLILVADHGSALAHRDVFNDPSPTDVITLSYDPIPGLQNAPSGELIVNIQRALEEGPKHPAPWSPNHELALYIAHGCDHLTGADDHSDSDFHRMRNRELRWIAAAGPLNLLSYS